MKKLKYIIEEFKWLKILNSPFKPFTVKWYVGETQIGTPYFLPRKWVNRKPVPLKVGFSYCGLGWKTKWTYTDFRYEWGPVFSFVFFGYQIAAMVGHKDASHYWEAWLYYEYATDKTKSKRERIEQCKKEFPQTWTTLKGGSEETIDYYTQILKPKYLIK